MSSPMIPREAEAWFVIVACVGLLALALFFGYAAEWVNR